MIRLLRKFIQETIRSSNARLAVMRINPFKAVLYDVDQLIKWSQNPVWNYDDFLTHPIVLGYIKIQAPDENCSDAYVVQSIGGPGWGHILYPIGHAMSPSGKLAPDRTVLSASARNAWKKRWGELSPEELLPMDDPRTHKENGTAEAEHPFHTDTKWDDCPTYNRPGWDHLNWVYPAPQGAQELLSSLENEHNNLLNQLPNGMFTYVRQACVIGDYWVK